MPSSIIISVVIVFLCFSIYRWSLKDSALSKIPLVGEDGQKAHSFWISNAKDILEEGYTKVRRQAPSKIEAEKSRDQFKNSVYRIWTPDGYYCVIPQRYMDEIKNLPDHQVDFFAATLIVRFLPSSSWPLGLIRVVFAKQIHRPCDLGNWRRCC